MEVAKQAIPAHAVYRGEDNLSLGEGDRIRVRLKRLGQATEELLDMTADTNWDLVLTLQIVEEAV